MTFGKKILFFTCLFGALETHATLVNGWDIQAGDLKTHTKFFLEEEVETYTGDFMTHRIEHAPKKGTLFITIPVTVTKQTDTADLFDPLLFSIEYKGSVFFREKEDAFLMDYGLRPLTQLKIKLGHHKGTLLFAVPETFETKKFQIKYNGILIKDMP